MALHFTARFCLKFSNNKIFRTPQPAICLYKFYSVQSEGGKTTDEPVSYSKTAASKISAAQNLRLVDTPKDKDTHLWFKPYIIGGSIILFLIYFCILREENDIDEILKGDTTTASIEAKYVDLKLKLLYCEKNKLPTAALKAKIEEYEEILGKR